MKFEIWMGEHYSRFDHGLVHLKDGSTLPLKAWIHVATYGADSVLIADKERYVCGDFPVRWFTKLSGIEFYCWDSEVASVVLHNETGANVTVKDYGVLPAGESREYFNQKYQKAVHGWWECPMCGMKYREHIANQLDKCPNCGLELGLVIDNQPEQQEE